MSPDDLKALRRSLGMTQSEFGEWLAKEVNQLEGEDHKPVSAYTRQRIHQWESGDLALPYKIKYALAERRIRELENDKQRQTPKQRQKPS